jgi:hypothetical protein
LRLRRAFHLFNSEGRGRTAELSFPGGENISADSEGPELMAGTHLLRRH